MEHKHRTTEVRGKGTGATWVWREKRILDNSVSLVLQNYAQMLRFLQMHKSDTDHNLQKNMLTDGLGVSSF